MILKPDRPAARHSVLRKWRDLLAATSSFQASLQSSYLTALLPLSQCSTCPSLITIRAWFHSPARLPYFSGAACRS